jgi:hypothetical protein
MSAFVNEKKEKITTHYTPTWDYQILDLTRLRVLGLRRRGREKKKE